MTKKRFVLCVCTAALIWSVAIIIFADMNFPEPVYGVALLLFALSLLALLIIYKKWRLGLFFAILIAIALIAPMVSC